MISTCLSLFLALALVLPGCSDAGVLGTAQGGTPTDSVLPALPVAIVPAALGAMDKHYFATATLEPNKQAEVTARVSGVVLDLSTEEGNFVEPGQVLLRIEEDAYLHRLNQAEAEASKQKARFSRQEKMFEKDLISAEEYDAARTDLQAAKAARELAALELSHARVTTPFTGHIVSRFVDPGQMVNDNTSLFTVADMSRLLARVHVPAREFRNIKPGQPVTLTLDSNEERLCGEIILVSPIIDPSSGTVKVTVAIEEYPESTRPGDFAEVSIVTDRHMDTTLVPINAVFTDRGEQVVFVVKDDVALRYPVETGFQDDEQIEILSGIQSGDSVIVQGQRSVKHEQPVKVLPPIDFDEMSETGLQESHDKEEGGLDPTSENSPEDKEEDSLETKSKNNSGNSDTTANASSDEGDE